MSYEKSDVRAVQRTLNRLGARTTVDGVPGPLTRASVESLPSQMRSQLLTAGAFLLPGAMKAIMSALAPSADTPSKFVSEWVPLLNRRVGPVLAPIMAAQLALESNWGTKTAGAHNYGGLKWSAAMQRKYGLPAKVRTHEEIRGVRQQAVEPFVNFRSKSEFLDEYVSRITRLWPDALNARSARDYAKALVANPVRRYATDSQYVSSIEKMTASVNRRLPFNQRAPIA